MIKPIVFMADVAEAQQQLWLQALRSALPAETILPVTQLSQTQREQCEIAIVADGAQLHLCPNLKWVHSVWAGVEKLLAQSDLPIVRLVDPKLAQTMAESVLAWVLYLQRHMPAYAQQQSAHLWSPLAYRSAQQTQVGLLGLGELARAAAQRLVGNGYPVSAWSRNQKHFPGVSTFCGEDGLINMLKGCDIVVCLLPLTEATRGLFNQQLISCLPKGAGLINFARGAILNTDEVLLALHQGQLSHAVLDVFEQEPLPVESALWNHPKVTVLPHIAAPTDVNSAAKIVAENVNCYRRTGQIPNTVDLKQGY